MPGRRLGRGGSRCGDGHGSDSFGVAGGGASSVSDDDRRSRAREIGEHEHYRALGVARLRRKLRRRRGAPRRADAHAQRGERRAVPAHRRQRGVDQVARRRSGRQAAGRRQRGRTRAVAAGGEGRVPTRRCGRGPIAVRARTPAAARRRCRDGRRTARGGPRAARRRGAQAAHALQPRRVHGGAVGAGDGRRLGAHARCRSRGSRTRVGGRARTRPRRADEHVRRARAEGARRAALCRP